MVIPDWHHISEDYKAAIEYMQGRKDGTIKSVATPWEKFNDVGIDGLEWNNICIVAARPGGGKTLLTSLITRNAFALNPDQDFSVLDFQFEMIGRVSALRELSGLTGKSLKYYANAEKANPITQRVIDDSKKLLSSRETNPIFICEKPKTVDEFKSVVRKFFIAQGGKPIIVTLDHSVLLKQSMSQKSKMEVLNDFGAALTELKKEIPVLFLILSQLNRELESVDRTKPGSVGNYPKDSDVFGSDALLQHTDILLAINRPSKYSLNLYGPEKWMITDPNLLAFHFLKVRNGDPRLSWFYGDFKNMNIIQLDNTNPLYPEMKPKTT